MDDKSVERIILTVGTSLVLLAAAGLSHPSELRPWHIMRRTGSTDVKHYGEIYDYLDEGELLRGPVPQTYARAWEQAQAGSFSAARD